MVKNKLFWLQLNIGEKQLGNDINILIKIKSLIYVIYPVYLNTPVLQNLEVNLYQKIIKEL